MTIIVIVLVLVLLASWIISTQRRLVVMDENVNNAMSQIGVQLSSRFDALTALLDLAKGYAAHESQTLIETIKSRRSVITAKSTPEDVLKQEGVISEALGRISMVAERYPELKADKGYAKCMDAVDSYEKMVRTSRLIYNDSVTKLNRELRLFPTSLVAVLREFLSCFPLILRAFPAFCLSVIRCADHKKRPFSFSNSLMKRTIYYPK